MDVNKTLRFIGIDMSNHNSLNAAMSVINALQSEDSSFDPDFTAKGDRAHITGVYKGYDIEINMNKK